MSKLSDKEVQQFFDEVNTGPGGVKTPEPAFQRYRKHFMRDMDFSQFKKFSPEELIASARTSEELFLIREEYLTKLPNKGSGEPFWSFYNKRRLELGQMPSLYDMTPDLSTGKMKGVWGVPMDPQIVLRQGAASGHLHNKTVNRRLYSRFADWQQITGQRKLMNVVDTGQGPVLRKWKGIKPPTLASNAPANALVFDFETTGLLGEDADIISLGMFNTKTGKSSGVYAEFDQTRKYTGKVGEIVEKWNIAAKSQKLTSEKKLLEGFITRLEATGSDEALMGYNIKSFDIPKAFESAKKYGLHNRLKAAVDQKTIIDVAEYAQAFLSKQLGGKYVGWEAGTTEELGLKPLGWQLEAVAESLGVKTGVSHEARADAEMTAKLWEKLKRTEKWGKLAEEEFNVNNYLTAVKRHTGKDLLRITKDMSTVNFSQELGADESKYLRSFKEHLAETYPGRIKETVKQASSKSISAIGKVVKNKGRIAGAARYSAILAGTSIVMPGNIWKNAASSAGFEAARIAAKSAGAGGWKQLAAGVAGSVIVNALWAGGSKLNQPTNVAVKGVSSSLRFSGHDDAYNTIEGLRDEGFRKDTRHNLTEFGSGYQGPNPWLNPEYNAAEDIERYKIMRASKLGASEEELYKYYTEKEDPSEFLAASANAGTALHLLEEAKAVQAGRVEAAEELAYDPAANITGHIDLTYKSGAPADVKTLSGRRYREMERKGAFEKHTHQLNWYMNQKNAEVGYLEYINREDTTQRQTVEIAYSAKMHEEDMRKVQRVRRRVEREIEEGILDESLLPKTASLERLQAAAVEEAGETLENIERIPYLEEVYKQEMEYLNSVSGRRNNKRRQESRDKLALAGQRFSGKDDVYNTIEGLRHGGAAENVRKSLTDFGSGWTGLLKAAGALFSKAKKTIGSLFRRNKPELYQGFSVSEIKKSAKIAKNSSLEDFAKHMNVNLVDNPQQNKVLADFGGAAHMKVPDEEAIELGFKAGQNYVSPSLVQNSMENITGRTINREAISKYAIFHEAMEQHNLKALTSREMPTASKEAHKMSVVQEELFLRHVGDKDTLNTIYDLRAKTEPELFRNFHFKKNVYGTKEGLRPEGLAPELTKTLKEFNPNPIKVLFSQRFSGKDDAYNTIEGLRHGGIAEKIRKSLTKFGSGWIGLKNVISSLFSKVKGLFKGNQSQYYQGFSSSNIKETAKLAKSSTVEEFAKHMKVNLIGDDALAQKGILERFGGGVSVKPLEAKMTELERGGVAQISNFGFEPGQAYISPEAIQKSLKSIGVPQKNMSDATKVAIFHEAMERENMLALTSRGKSVSGSVAHNMSVVQEELFHRAYGEKNVSDAFYNYRNTPSQNPGFFKKAKGKNKYNPEAALRPKGLDPELKKTLKEFDSGGGRAKARRMKKFRDVSTEAVGIGHRAAHNAGKKHSSFRSTVNG